MAPAPASTNGVLKFGGMDASMKKMYADECLKAEMVQETMNENTNDMILVHTSFKGLSINWKHNILFIPQPVD